MEPLIFFPINEAWTPVLCVFLIFFYFAFPCHCRDSGASWLRWNRPSRQPGNSWETRTDGGSRQTGQSRAPWGLWCFHVLSDVRPQGTLQQGTQRLMTQQCVRRCCQLKRIEEVIYCVTALQRRTWTLLWQSVFREQLHRRQKQPHQMSLTEMGMATIHDHGIHDQRRSAG